MADIHTCCDEVKSGTCLVYDGACGTGGMLTVVEETLTRLAAEHVKEVPVHLYGQEINPETYAISKADLILKGEGVEADNMRYGSTLAADAFPASEIDVMLSNPPYGKSWKGDLERMGGKSGIRGLFEASVDGQTRVVEFEPDSELRDTEQVPLLDEGGIESFLLREVLPYASDAWYDPASVKVGYEISFTRYFDEPQPMRTLEKIRADILALERETEGLLEEILGE